MGPPRKGEETPKEPNNKKLVHHFFFVLPTLTGILAAFE